MRTQLAGLDVQVVQQSRQPARAAVVLCHGFGAPGDDLVPLAQELAALAPELADVRFYFPAAPLVLEGVGAGAARAWWMIDFPTVQRLQQGDAAALREFRKLEPEGMDVARKHLLKLVQDVATQNGLPMSKVLLGGFSQGAMLATDVALRTEEAPAGLAILSGTLLLEDVWRSKATARTGLQVFQAHGRRDPLLPFTAAQWLLELLQGAGLAVEFFPFDDGHTITAEELRALARFLTARLS